MTDGIILIYPKDIGVSKDGTSIFLRRLFNRRKVKYLQVQWDNSFNCSRQAIYIKNKYARWWPFYLGKGFFERLFRGIDRRFKLNLVNFKKSIEALQAKLNINPAMAYVVVLTEDDASLANQMIARLNMRYALHIMDITHSDGLSLQSTPHFCRLLKNASNLMAISARALAEMEPQSDAKGLVLPCCSFLDQYDNRRAGSPFTIAITGAVYSALDVGSTAPLDYLMTAIQRLLNLAVAWRFIYIGVDYDKLPQPLKVHFENLGFTDDMEAVCRSTHLMIMPVHYAASAKLAYSVPSRISDFLISGCPVLCSCDEETALNDLIIENHGQGLLKFSNETELYEYIKDLALDGVKWENLSAKSAVFGQSKFSFEAIKGSLPI